MATGTFAEKEKETKKETEGAPEEIGGYKGQEPTRYGDWDIKGRCSDF
jgi:hypothetical protein